MLSLFVIKRCYNVWLRVRKKKYHKNFDSLQYADKAGWLIDLMYYITSIVAVGVVIYCAARLLTGGWGDLEAEIKGRKGLWTALIAIVLLRLGLMLIGVVFGW